MATGSEAGTHGPAASSLRYRNCGRAATFPTGCWSGAGGPNRRWSAWSPPPICSASAPAGWRSWCRPSASPGCRSRRCQRWPKDGAFNQEISDLVGQTRVSRTNWQTGAMAGRTFSGEDIAIIRPEEIRQLPERHALVIAENGKPIIARLSRCIDGRKGARLLAGQQHRRGELAERHSATQTAEARAAAALVEARRRGIAAEPGPDR